VFGGCVVCVYCMPMSLSVFVSVSVSIKEYCVKVTVDTSYVRLCPCVGE